MCILIQESSLEWEHIDSGRWAKVNKKAYRELKAKQRLAKPCKAVKTFNMNHRIIKTKAYNDRNTSKQMTKLFNADVAKIPCMADLQR